MRAYSASFWLGLVVISLIGALFWSISAYAPAPWGDDGGYQQMLFYFLRTGKIDYMHWSQPTFIGVLPLAIPWCSVAGETSLSFDRLGALYTTFFMIGLYLFLFRFIKPSISLLLCASMLCFTDFVLQAPTFMTDVPACAYLIWFMFFHRKLEEAYTEPENNSYRKLFWVGWCTFYMLSVLTRSTLMMIVPLLCLHAILQRKTKSKFPNACVVSAIAASIICMVIVTLIGENRMSFSELTAIPLILGNREWARFDLRCFCTSLLQTVAMAFPALVLSRHANMTKIRPVEIAIGIGGIALTFYFWRKYLLDGDGLFPSRMPCLSFAFVIIAPVALVISWRLMLELARLRKSSTAVLLVGLVIGHFAVLPIMMHPLLRHSLAAFIGLICMVAMGGVEASRRRILVCLIAVAIVGARNVQLLCHDRAVNAAAWDMATKLVSENKTTAKDLDGGWAWFCYQQLHPGESDPDGYGVRFKRLEKEANVSVHTDATIMKSPSDTILDQKTISNSVDTTVVYALRRAVF